jgi:transposase, IS5 family
MGGAFIRTIDIVRAAMKVGMQHLVYSMRRLVVL